VKPLHNSQWEIGSLFFNSEEMSNASCERRGSLAYIRDYAAGPLVGSIPACLSFSIVRVVSSRALLPCEGKIGLNG
ncbi:hypothetical protein A2U01_0038439, partial [Trifolium medium]|nr:hypothetical protein [Trifolium medium]